jgi:hypothetical protein
MRTFLSTSDSKALFSIATTVDVLKSRSMPKDLQPDLLLPEFLGRA